MSNNIAVSTLRIRKLFSAASSPQLRRPGCRGVFASLELTSLLPNEAPDLVIDIGANRGQFALLTARHFPTAEIVCVEPLARPAAMLNETLRQIDNSSVVHQVALSDTDTKTSMNVARGDDSSSLLQPTKPQTNTFTEASIVRCEEVKVRRGEFLLHNEQWDQHVLMKIDVQGSEFPVLEGFGRRLEQVDYLIIELSLVELYEGQALASELIAFLKSRGFDLVGFGRPLASGTQQMQIDAAFAQSRSKTHSSSDPKPARSPATDT